MKQPGNSGLVPEQHTGKPVDAESTVELENSDDAKRFFETVKKRLQHVNSWHDMAGQLSAIFQLMNAEGQPVDRPVQKGDYFRIDVPGPGTGSGEGFDWVQVEEIEDIAGPESEVFGIRVRPSSNPHDSQEKVAHFYSEQSTSTFTVQRQGLQITAGIYDRNTKPNQESASAVDKVRNAVVGFFGVLSLSKIHWKALTEGLLKRDGS